MAPITETSPEILSYFVATLADAKRINESHPHGIATINQLLDERAVSDPDVPVIGMPVAKPGDRAWGSIIYTFRNLYDISNNLAYQLVEDGVIPAVKEEEGLSPPTAAILAASSVEFLMTFLALMRVGYSVLLIAPQCTKSAVAHLIETTNADHVFTSQSYTSLAPPSCLIHPLPSFLDLSPPPHYPAPCPIFTPSCIVHALARRYPTPRSITASTTAYIHHTSGTTGHPNTIPHTHSAATSHLPHLPPPTPTAAFSTTPLYHGGIADTMRALMSSSLLWLYPPSVPVTSCNILRSLKAAYDARHPVKLFTGVPYVLGLCVVDEELLTRLAGMEMVGVGGAPLGVDVGSELVGRGVKLVSRFGSSECGFLMSSYRDFRTDYEWEYLRVPSGCKSLDFVPQSGGRLELIVRPEWPQSPKPNCPDGSYATGDLFIPHATIKDAYKYNGRSDATIVLSNGKKLSVSPIEDLFRADPVVREAVVFGNDKPFPGVLIFLREDLKRPGDVGGSGIMKEMVVCLSPGVAVPRNSKGEVMRGAVGEEFKEEIDKAYREFERRVGAGRVRRDDINEVLRLVVDVVDEVAGRKMEGWWDLFLEGVDSVMAAQIRNRLAQGLAIGKELPLNVVFEQRTIEGLALYITTGSEAHESLAPQQHGLMLRLVEKYSNFDSVGNPGTAVTDGHVVVIFLCRAADHEHARERMHESLYVRNLPGCGGKVDVEALAVELGRKDLGLGREAYEKLRGEVTMVIHAAWAVNFVTSLESFERDHIAGTRHLIDLTLAAHHRSTFHFLSSTAAVLGSVTPPATITETFPEGPSAAAPLGYARSKWVAEKICQKLGRRASVIRIGQLCADTVNGVWNETEAWPLLLKSVNVVGCLPELKERVSWLPVDMAAGAVVDVVVREKGERVRVFQVVNADVGIEWSEVLDWIQECGDVEFERVPPGEWVKRLAETEDGERNPSRKLLGLWEASYGEGVKENGVEASFKFEVGNTVGVSEALGNGEGWKMDKGYVQKIWKNWVQSGFIKV